MHKVLSIIIFALALVALIVLIVAGYGQYQLLLAADVTLQSQRFMLLPGIAVSAGVLIAALTFLRERGKTEMERRRHVSEVLLKRAIDAFNSGISLLSDRNNSRMVWIRAARTLLQARRLGAEISSDEYKRAYELEEERVRNDLYVLLTLPDEKSSGRKPLPPQFFYGIEDWSTCPTLDEAAIRASQNPVAYSISIDSVPPQAHMRPLSDRSVVTIFSFVEYPKTYDDPLDDVVVWDDNWDQSHDIDQGARRYVAHTNQKFAIGGKLHERPKRTDASKQ